MFLETRVEVRHTCCFSRFSSMFPRSKMALWSPGSADVLRVDSPDPQELLDVLRAARRDLRARDVEQGRTDAIMFLPCQTSWHRSPSVAAIADRNGVWLLLPIVFRDGAETYRVIAPNRTLLRRFLNDLKGTSRIVVLSHRTRGQFSAADLGAPAVELLEGVTSRQQETLAIAFEGGLLEIPARRTMDSMARLQGVSRSTFGEHLRKAQGRLLRNVYPLLESSRRQNSIHRSPRKERSLNPQLHRVRRPL